MILFGLFRDFRLHLDTDKSVFHPEAIIENSVARISYDTSKAVVGHLDGKSRFLTGIIITVVNIFSKVLFT